jgi:hypothetical protein
MQQTPWPALQVRDEPGLQISGEIAAVFIASLDDPIAGQADVALRALIVTVVRSRLRVQAWRKPVDGIVYRARLAFLTVFGVTLRLTVRTGCAARLTPQGTNIRDRNPMDEDRVSFLGQKIWEGGVAGVASFRSHHIGFA